MSNHGAISAAESYLFANQQSTYNLFSSSFQSLWKVLCLEPGTYSTKKKKSHPNCHSLRQAIVLETHEVCSEVSSHLPFYLPSVVDFSSSHS